MVWWDRWMFRILLTVGGSNNIESLPLSHCLVSWLIRSTTKWTSIEISLLVWVMNPGSLRTHGSSKIQVLRPLPFLWHNPLLITFLHSKILEMPLQNGHFHEVSVLNIFLLESHHPHFISIIDHILSHFGHQNFIHVCYLFNAKSSDIFRSAYWILTFETTTFLTVIHCTPPNSLVKGIEFWTNFIWEV